MLRRGELEKLRITAYAAPTFNDSDKISDGEFETLINPEKYDFNYRIEQNNDQASGTSAISSKFNKTLPENLDLSFVFDRTGAIKGSEAKDSGVVEDVEKFKKVIFNYDGDIHQPNYLKIFWGTLIFKGKLTEMDIEFKLFNPDGTPIRAIANAKFQGFVEDQLRVNMENNNSPDLTHIRTAQAGDTLPLMSFRIYGDSKYYLAVAKVNNIHNFRTLRVGQQILFPPLR